MSETPVKRAAEALEDYLEQLGVNGSERPEHGGPSIAEVLARVVFRSIDEKTGLRNALNARAWGYDNPAGTGGAINFWDDDVDSDSLADSVIEFLLTD